MSETEKVENKNISLIFRIEVEARRNIWIKIRRGVGSCLWGKELREEERETLLSFYLF